MDALSPCLTWISILRKIHIRLFTQVTPVDLPSEVIVDIFSKIPAGLVVECCHQWNLLRALTSSQSFIDKHLKQATFDIVSLGSYYPSKDPIHKSKISIIFIDKKGENLFHKYIEFDFSNIRWMELTLYSSHCGLLFFGYAENVILWNPVTQEKTFVKKESGFRPCGFCMDPKTREWKIVYVRPSGSCQFIIYNLRTKLSKKSKLFSHPPCVKPPVILDGSLYWVVDDDCFESTTGMPLEGSESILALDIVSENIRTIAQPVGIHERRGDYNYVNLLEMRDNLGFCDSSNSTYPNLDIWLFRDEMWSIKHRVNLQFRGTPFDSPVKGILTVEIVKDDLFLAWVSDIYRYDIISCTWKKFKQQPAFAHSFAFYKASLVSLDSDSNISPEIYSKES